MSEFKFYCPACSRYINGDSSEAGKPIGCPMCFRRIVVPLPPGLNDSKYIVMGTLYNDEKPPEGTAVKKAPMGALLWASFEHIQDEINGVNTPWCPSATVCIIRFEHDKHSPFLSFGF
jgi:DNA-directed RNA polymerase subunit RPC12/RpoP